MKTRVEDLVKLSQGKGVLVVDDDDEYLQGLKELFEDIFSKVHIANDGQKALEIFENHDRDIDIVITDLYMPSMGGIELIKQIQAKNKGQSFLVISAYECVATLLECLNLGISKFILKPGTLEELVKSLREILMHIELQKESHSHLESLEHLLEEKNLALQDNHRAIHKLQMIDAITQLPNYSSCSKYLSTFEDAQKVTVMLFDIDNFSLINQFYGFEKGNVLLKKIADLLLTCTQNLKGKLFRYISDEFVLVFAHEVISVEDIVGKVQACFQDTPIDKVDGISLYVTLSCGVSISEQHHRVVFEAAEALKNIKIKYIPNQFSRYDTVKVDIKNSENDIFWLNKTRKALDEHKLVPYFHPIVDNHSQKIISYECLARIVDEDELSYPASFLGAARRGALLGAITKSMIQQSFEIFASKQSYFSINLSHEDLLDIKFASYVEEQIKRYNIDAKRVIFEILENIIIDEEDDIALLTLKKLKEIGCKIALDDFGNDKSNFNRFEYIGVDFIKIDGQFIHDIDRNELNQNIIKSIVALAKNLHIKVVAEFISNEKEYECAKKLGIDYSQGYYFYTPMSAPLE